MSAVVLLSGGLDSCVTTAIAVSKNTDIHLLHITYGHRTMNRELKAFNDIAHYYSIKNILTVDIDYLVKIGHSALTDSSIEVPENTINYDSIPVTYVPFRNGNFLSIAASFAETVKSDKIYIGAVYEDSSGYPDTTPEFIEKMEYAINCGTKPETQITICAPLLQKTKSEIVSLGISLKAPLQLSWSCYQNDEKACGTCESCLLRLKGFEKAGLKDPIQYV